MQKIISLFQRNYDGDRLVRDEVVPGAEWVLAGEGEATRKFDGTCCLLRNGRLYKRYDAKKGKHPPAGFEPAQDPDPTTGHWPGWLPVGNSPADYWHLEAIENSRLANGWCPLEDGTYELCGPKVQGNPEKLKKHVLIPHGSSPILMHTPDGQLLRADPRTFESIREYLRTQDIEGIVWHHQDGRMVKIKGKDFGFKRAILAGDTDPRG